MKRPRSAGPFQAITLARKGLLVLAGPPLFIWLALVITYKALALPALAVGAMQVACITAALACVIYGIFAPIRRA